MAAASAQGLQGLSQPRPAMGCTHLGLDALEGLLQQQREAAHLTLEPIVVVGQGPQRWLQRQQVGPDTYGDTRGERQTGRRAVAWGRLEPGWTAHLPGSRAQPSSPPGLWQRPPRWPGSCPPPGTASPPASARAPAPAPTRTWRSEARARSLVPCATQRKKPRPSRLAHVNTHTGGVGRPSLSLKGLGAPCSYFPASAQHQPGSRHITQVTSHRPQESRGKHLL